MKKDTQYIAIGAAIAVLVISGMMLYFSYSIRVLRQDYDAKLYNLNQQTLKSMQVLGEHVDALGSNLSAQLEFLDTSLEGFKKQNQKEIDALSGLIDQIEEQSNIRLNELKDELKNVQIKSADFSAIVDDVLHSVVSVRTNTAQGSGAIIGTEGYIVTNVHVISGASTIRITTYDDDTYNAEIVGYDTAADIAVLKIDSANLKALEFGDSGRVKIGERVIAAGNPAGLAFTVTEGIVSAIRTGANNLEYIQTDVPINPGNSGGPLINIQSELIGINNFKYGGFESLGFAIASNEVEDIVNGIISQYEASQQQ